MKWLHLLAFSLTLGILLGCTSAAPTPPPAATAPSKAADAEDKDDHEHGEGPHGGVVFDWGKYHVEFCMDHKAKEATVYVLSTNLKRAVPIAAEKMKLSIKKPAFEVELQPKPLDGETGGKSSRFVARHENFGVEQEFEGTLTGVVLGKPLAADFAEEEHEEHEEKK